MSFLANARVMLGGFAIAQSLPILVAPLLTRLFAPEAFGLQTLFMSCLSVLIVLSTLRLDLALVMAEDQQDAQSLTTIVLLNTLMVSSALLVVLTCLGESIAGWLEHEGTTFWLWLLVPALAAAAISQTFLGLLSRERRFKDVAKANILNQMLYVTTALLFGVAGTSVTGLVTARLAGQIGLAVFAGYVCWSMIREISISQLSPLADLWVRYNQFVIYNTPYSLIGSIAREMPVYAFVATTATAAAGFYGLARSIMLVPSMLMSASLSQVFYREAVDLKGTPELEAKATALLTLSLCIFTPLLAFVCAWGDELFGFVFGQRWQTAGVYSMVLAPAAWLSIQTAWPERLFEVFRKQDISFRLQIFFDVLTAVAVLSAITMVTDPLFVIAAFSLVNCAYHLFYLHALATVSAFDVPKLRGKLLTGSVVFAGATIIQYALRVSTSDSVPLMLVCAGASTGVALILGIMHFDGAKLTMETKATDDRNC